MTTNQYTHTFKTYRMKVFNFCNKIVGQRQNAEDITSIVFIKLWDRKDLVPTDKAVAFLMKISYNECIDFLRRTKTYSEAISKSSMESSLEETFNDSYSDVLCYIHSAIESLTPNQKAIFTMRYFEEKDYTQISQLLNLKKQTIANVLYAATNRIREYLAMRGIQKSPL